MRTSKKVLLGIIISVGGFFVIGLTATFLWAVTHPEDYERNWEKQVQREAEERRAELRKQELEKQKEVEELRVAQFKQLPASCDAVNSMDLDIYPTGKQCFEALNKRIEDWCTSQSEGNPSLVKGCVNMFYLKLADTCQGSNEGLLGVPEDVCLMYTMKEMYAKLIPE